MTNILTAYQAVRFLTQIHFNLPEAQDPDYTKRDAHPEVVVVASEAYDGLGHRKCLDENENTVNNASRPLVYETRTIKSDKPNLNNYQ